MVTVVPAPRVVAVVPRFTVVAVVDDVESDVAVVDVVVSSVTVVEVDGDAVLRSSDFLSAAPVAAPIVPIKASASDNANKIRRG